MQYKTIVLEMLEQRTELHKYLRKERKLLATLTQYALELKASHEAIRNDLLQAYPQSHPQQISSEAFELALKDLEDHLPPASPADEPEEPSLDAAMTFLRKHSPPK